MEAIDHPGSPALIARASGRLPERSRLDVGLSDHRRLAAQLTFADDERTAHRIIAAIRALLDRLDDVPSATPISLPEPGELELEQAMLPRDAFFGPAEHVPADAAAGRICAETISPCPPGVPALLPGEIITKPVLEYLRTGLAAGMYIPDAADPNLDTIRVVSS